MISIDERKRIDVHLKIVIEYLKYRGISRWEFERQMRLRAENDLAIGKNKEQVMYCLDTAMAYWDQ